MHIKKIYTYKKDIGFSKPYTISFKTIDKVVCAFVQLELENGIKGYGSGIPSVQVVKESFDDCMQALSLENLSFLIGMDIRNFPAILELLHTKLPNNPSAKAALDIALHDAYTKWLDVPLHSYLGRRIDRLPTSVTIGIKGVEDSLDDAEDYIQQGFKVLKIKLGQDAVSEIKRLEKIRKRYPDILIRLDANQAFSKQSFLAFYEICRQLDIEFYEQPLAASDISTMRSMPEEIRRVTAADESCINTKDAFQLVQGANAFGIFNIKLMKAGGISQALKIADIAALGSLKLMFGCNNESAISVTAALHAAYSCPHTAFIDLDGAFNMKKDEALAGFDVVDGFLVPKEASGLGIKVN